MSSSDAGGGGQGVGRDDAPMLSGQDAAGEYNWPKAFAESFRAVISHGQFPALGIFFLLYVVLDKLPSDKMYELISRAMDGLRDGWLWATVLAAVSLMACAVGGSLLRRHYLRNEEDLRKQIKDMGEL